MRSLKEERLGMTKQMKDGYICTVVEYNGANNITVKYEDGREIKHRLFRDFETGGIHKYTNEEIYNQRIGEKKMMHCGMECTIVAYRSYNDIDVEFDDGYKLFHRNYGKFKDGGIQNKNLDYIHLDNLIGKRFGRWLVIGKDEERTLASKLPNKSTSVFWFCKCDCGNIRSVSGSNLKYGNSNSCGCLESEMTKKRNRETKCIYGKLKDEAPNLVKYLENKENGELTIGSQEKVNCICPKCKESKIIPLYRLYERGFNCPNCSSKVSYPNRFIFKLLKQLNIQFETEEVFDWAKNKRYDFYILILNCIIEAHGMQHYKDSSWSTVQFQQENDALKENLALSNGIVNYIQLDCRKSNMEYIKQSILNNEKMGELFDLTKIDWNKIDKELREV